jgi:hypothetical protein
MMASVVAWGSIKLFHNVVLTLNLLNERLGTPLPIVCYRAKIKLHGTNCAIQVRPEGVYAQGRTQMLTTQDDFKGFAKWLDAIEAYTAGIDTDLTIFGEWCGPGVEPGMALSTLPKKLFAVFSVQRGEGDGATIIYDPKEIEVLIAPLLKCDDVKILPWYGDEITVDFGDQNSLERTAAIVNKIVEDVEREDPWVKATYGVSGIGEGIVLYPIGIPTDATEYSQYMWKAKGDEHRNTRAKAAAQVKPEAANGIDDFVDLVVTEARLKQGLSTVCNGVKDKKLTGKFIQWVVSDTEKESTAELEASGLTWKQVAGAVQNRARQWFMAP